MAIKIRLFLFCLMFVTHVAAQGGLWNIKAGYCQLVKSNPISPSKMPELRAELNYQVKRFGISPGIYGGYIFESGGFPSFGANFNFHPLSLLANTEKFRFDAYVTSKFGFIRYDELISYDWPSPGLNVLREAHFGIAAHLGIGVSYYFISFLGLFAEYGYEWFQGETFANKGIMRCGLTIKF